MSARASLIDECLTVYSACEVYMRSAQLILRTFYIAHVVYFMNTRCVTAVPCEPLLQIDVAKCAARSRLLVVKCTTCAPHLPADPFCETFVWQNAILLAKIP